MDKESRDKDRDDSVKPLRNEYGSAGPLESASGADWFRSFSRSLVLCPGISAAHQGQAYTSTDAVGGDSSVSPALSPRMLRSYSR